MFARRLRYRIQSAAEERDHAAFKGFVDELIAGTNRSDHAEDGIADPKYTADMIVTAAEAAIELSEFGLPQAITEMKAIATDLLRRFWISDPAKNQYYIRACYSQAVLDGVNAHVLKEPELISTVMVALSHLERGLDLALEPHNVSRYGFLVYNASVHLWNIVRPLMRPGSSRTLVPLYTKVVEALQTVDSDNYAWRVRSAFNLCRCLDDEGKPEEGLKFVEAAKALAKDHAPELLPWAYRLQMHLSRSKGQAAMVDVTKSCEPESGLLALPYIQATRSLDLNDAEVVTALTAAMDALQGEGKPCEAHVDGQQLPAELAEAVVSVGRIAALTVGGKAIAERCITQCYGTKDMRVAQMLELIRAAIIVNDLGEDIKLYTEHTVQQLTQAVVMVEKGLQMAIRADDGELIQDTCVVAWNFSLRLLQPTLRERAKTVLHIAAEALEKLESSSHQLRALLHLEMTKCELANELVKKADQHCTKSLALDYAGNQAQVEKYDLLRPLDRFLLPIKQILDLKVSMYAQPERPEEKALLVVDQARPAKNPEVVGSLLERAAAMIVDSQTTDPSPPPDAEAGTVSAVCRERALLWVDIAKIAWKSRLSRLARQGAAEVIKLTLADQVKDRDLVTLQGELACIEGEAFLLDKKTSEEEEDFLVSDKFVGVGRVLGHDLWSDVNMGEEEWDCNVGKQGWLQMRMPPGRDIGSTKDLTSRLYQECGHSVFDVSTHVEFGGAQGTGGISVCSYADRDWMALKVGIANDDPSKRYVRWEHKGHMIGSVEIDKAEVYLRVLKNYEDYSAFWKYNEADEWTQMVKTLSWATEQPPDDSVEQPPDEPAIINVQFQSPFEVGIFAGNTADEGESEIVNFEYVDVLSHNELASRRFLHATRIGLELEEEWMVRNGAIYCLNYNLPLIKLGRAHLFLPHWQELVDAFFKDGAKIAKTNLPIANELSCVLAAALEQTVAISKGGIDRDDGIEFGSGQFPAGLESSSEYRYVRGLRELFGEKLTNPELTKLIEVTTQMLALLTEPMRKADLLQLQTRAKCLIGQDVVKMPDESPAGVCRVVVLLEELAMKQPDAQAVQFLNRAVDELTASETAEEKPADADADGPPVEPSKITPNSEMWVGIAQAALRYTQYRIAQDCATSALSDSSGPDRLETAQVAMAQLNANQETASLAQLELGQQRLAVAQKERKQLKVDEEMQHKWRWYSLGESSWGAAILGQIEPTRQDFGIQNQLSGQALTHFAQAAKYGAAISNSSNGGVGADLVLKASKLCWNGAIPNMTSEISRRMLFDPLKALVQSIMLVEEQTPVLSNAEAESLSPQDRFNYELKVSLYRLLLKCYEEKGENADGVTLCERALSITPSKFQKSLWEAKMVMMSKLGRNVAGELSRLKEANPVLQAKMLSKLARSAKKPSEQITSLQKILVLLADQPLEQVDYMIQLAECMFANSCPAADVLDQLLAAADILLDVEDDGDSGGGARGYDGSMAGSTYSGQTSATGQTNKTGGASSRRGSTSRRSSVGRRSSISRKPSVAGSASGGSVSGSSRKSGASGRAGNDEEQAATVLNVGQLLKMARIMALMAMVAPTTADALECTIQSQHYFSRVLSTHAKTKRDGAAESDTPMTLPEAPTEWLAYPLETVDTIVQSAQQLPDGNMMVISSDSVDAADHTVVCLAWVLRYLMDCNYLLLCLPLAAVFEIVTAGVLKRSSGAKVARMHVATVLSKLGRTCMYTEVVKSIGKVTIAKEELDQGRLEVQRRVQVKKTLEDEGPASPVGKKMRGGIGLKSAGKMLGGLQRMGAKVVLEETKVKMLMSVSDRQLWVQMAAAALEEGWCQQAKQLVHEARRHADAFDDVDTTAWCDYLDGKLAYIGGANACAIENLNRMRSKYTELELWARGTLLVAQIQHTQHLYTESTLTLESAVKLVERLMAPSTSELSKFGAPVLMAMVPEIHGWFVKEMADQMLHALAPGGKGVLNDANMTAVMEKYAEAEACFGRAGNSIKMIECMLSRANKMVKMPIGADGYDCKPFLTEMVNNLCTFEASAKLEIAKYNKVCSSEVMINPLTDALANIEVCLTQLLLILAYLEEQAENAKYARMTVVDKFLLDNPDLTVIPLVNKALFYASTACALQVTPKMHARCVLVLGQATAASYRKEALDAMYVGKKRMEVLESDLDRLSKAYDEATEASKAAAVKSASKKFEHNGEKKPKDLVAREAAISKQKKVQADMKKKSVDEKKKEITAEQVLLTALEQRADPWTTNGKRSESAADGRLSTAKDCSGKVLIEGEGKGVIALQYLDEAMGLCAAQELWTEASHAAIGKANMYGAMDTRLCREAIIMAQSMSAREDLTAMFLDNATPTDREAIFMRLRAHLASNRVEADSSLRFVAVSNFLEKSSVTWKTLNNSTSIANVAEALPEGVQVLVWHMHKLPEPQLYCTVLSKEPESAEGAPPLAKVYRSSCEETDQLIQLNGRMAKLHAAQRVQLYKAGKLSEDMCALSLELRAEMNSMFAPLLEPFRFAAPADGAPPQCVLIGPEQFGLLPLDRLKVLEKAFSSMSMDLSTHILHARILAAQGEGVEVPPVALDLCTFIVDCKNESDSLCPMITKFEEMRKPHGMTKWDGRSGNDHAVTQGEWQQILLQASDNKQAALYYGFSKCLGHLEPSSLMGLDLSDMPMMILLDRVENDTAYQNGVRSEFDKVHCRQQAETAFGTAALLSLRGVSTVMLNRGPTGFEANQACFKSLLELKGGASKAGANFAQLVRQIVTKAEGPVPRASSKAGKASAKGKKSKKGEAPTPAAEPEAGLEVETGMTACCFGLGFSSLK